MNDEPLSIPDNDKIDIDVESEEFDNDANKTSQHFDQNNNTAMTSNDNISNTNTNNNNKMEKKDSLLLGSDSNNVDKLKRLAMRYTELTSTLDQKSRSMAILKNANHELNQYITDIESHHTKELATLKAKISLTRIENEVHSSSSSLAQTRDDGGIPSSKSNTKVKKRRSSLLRFFSSSSKVGGSTTSSLNTSSSSLETTASTRDNDLQTSEKYKLKEDILKKSILIEELQKKCNDHEQRTKILESAVHNKNIELSVKGNRLTKLNDDIKSHVGARVHFVAILNELEDTVLSLNKKLNHTQGEMRENRAKTKENQTKVQTFFTWLTLFLRIAYM